MRRLWRSRDHTDFGEVAENVAPVARAFHPAGHHRINVLESK